MKKSKANKAFMAKLATLNFSIKGNSAIKHVTKTFTGPCGEKVTAHLVGPIPVQVAIPTANPDERSLSA